MVRLNARNGKMVAAVCKQCQGAFEARQVDINRGKATLCSRQCLFLWQSKVSNRYDAKIELVEIDGTACANIEIARFLGRFVLIEAADLDWFLDFPGGWTRSLCDGAVYIRASRGRKLLHQFLVDAPPKHYVDHKNGDTTDCRRSNLRPVTYRQSVLNRGVRQNSKRQFIGVFWSKRDARWTSQLTDINGNRWGTGSHTDGMFAAMVRDKVASWLHGPFARLNFQYCSEAAANRAARIIADISARGAVQDVG